MGRLRPFAGLRVVLAGGLGQLAGLHAQGPEPHSGEGGQPQVAPDGRGQEDAGAVDGVRQLSPAADTSPTATTRGHGRRRDPTRSAPGIIPRKRSQGPPGVPEGKRPTRRELCPDPQTGAGRRSRSSPRRGPAGHAGGRSGFRRSVRILMVPPLRTCPSMRMMPEAQTVKMWQVSGAAGCPAPSSWRLCGTGLRCRGRCALRSPAARRSCGRCRGAGPARRRGGSGGPGP